MKVETKQRKKATSGFRELTGKEQTLNLLAKVICDGKKGLDSLMLEMGRTLAECIMLIEREEIAGPDYCPRDPQIQKWAYEDGSVYIADQKIKVTRPRLRHTVDGEMTLESYKSMSSPGIFSEELLDKVLRGLSAQKYRETVVESAKAFGVSPSAVSQKIVEITSLKLAEFKERNLSAFKAFSLFLDTIHRGGEAFIVALGVDLEGNKKALGFWQGSSENHEICEELFGDLERRGLTLSKKIIYVTDGGKGIIKALRDRFGKKLLHQRCVLHKGRNLQKHLAKRYRKESHRLLSIALEQNTYEDARKMLVDLEKWLRSKNESAADSLLEAFEEILTLHRLKVPALLRKTLMSTNPIESMFSTVRKDERNIKRKRGSGMLQRWLGAVLLKCEAKFNRVHGAGEILPVRNQIETNLKVQPEDFRKAA